MMGPPAPRQRTPAWLWAVPVFTCGLLGFLPAVVIAAKCRTRSTILWAVGFALTSLVGFLLTGMQSSNADNLASDLGAFLLLAMMVGGACYGVIAGAKVHWATAPLVDLPPPPGYVGPPVDPNAQAIAGVMAARQKRAEARTLAQRDPHLARDLRIGRPDLPRHYDDGGLVDINSAPADALVRGLGLTPALATHVIDVRRQLGGFERVDDLVNLAGVPDPVYDQVVERIIVL